MYSPPAFREERVEVMHALMRAHPLAMLITAGEGGLIANPVPFSIVGTTGNGLLRAHIAAANDQVPALRGGTEALVVFQGPQAYVTPSWYPSKREHGRVVPTWNYVVVQARGIATVIDDPAWLRAQVAALTAEREHGRAAPWQVEDAPESFVAAQMKGIVGLEIPIARLEGKWKISQNRADADRLGVAEGLRDEGAAPDMATLVGTAGRR